MINCSSPWSIAKSKSIIPFVLTLLMQWMSVLNSLTFNLHRELPLEKTWNSGAYFHCTTLCDHVVPPQINSSMCLPLPLQLVSSWDHKHTVPYIKEHLPTSYTLDAALISCMDRRGDKPHPWQMAEHVWLNFKTNTASALNIQWMNDLQQQPINSTPPQYFVKQ